MRLFDYLAICTIQWLYYFSEEKPFFVWAAKSKAMTHKTWNIWKLMTKIWALLKYSFLKKCFDIPKIIFNYNQTTDKIYHWILKSITIYTVTNIAIKISQTVFHV